jgi:hypothetical protein
VSRVEHRLATAENNKKGYFADSLTTSKFYNKCEENCIAKAKWHTIGVFDIGNTARNSQY